MEHILILGLGVSGKDAARLLLSEQKKVIAVDRQKEMLKESIDVQKLQEAGLILLSEEEEIDFSKISYIILSPGVSPRHKILLKATSLGIEIIGEAEFALRRLSNRCIGVTGTNGKTTTTLLITHVLKSAHIAARALGNVGSSLSSYVAEADPDEILVLELSSFQLETFSKRCLLGAVILNVTPDHLDRYDSMEEYAAAKARIGRGLLENAPLFVSKESKKYVPSGIMFGDSLESCQNTEAARLLCGLCGVNDSQFREALKTFRRPSHRIEWVAEKNGRVYYNDSKATNIDAVEYAVSSLNQPLILLIGGRDKGASYAPWITKFQGKVKMMIAFGEAAFKMEEELAPFFHFVRVACLKEAVQLASQLEEKDAAVLLSPGCSSYDQFRNYEHRGDEFKRLVKEEI